MTREVKEIVCDRCGERLFLRRNDKPGLYNIYEDKPDSWTNYHNKDLCPDCTKAYLEIVDDFMNRRL